MDLMTIASVAMQADHAKMESISQNVANVLTPGYKRQITVNSGFAAQFSQLGAATAARSPELSGPPATQLKLIDPASGALRQTGSSNDVAIEGNGFFEVQTQNGVAYTKQGSLRVDAQGRLVNLQDLPLMGNVGEIRLTNGPFTIASNGDISQDGRVAGRIKVIHFDKASELIPTGNGIYQLGRAQILNSPQAASLRIGFLEGSNVNSPQEMVRLTETVRHFESLQRMVQGYDETLEKTIRKLGDF